MEFQDHKKCVGKKKTTLQQPQRFVSVIQNCDLLGKDLQGVLNGCKTLEDLEA